MAATDPDRAHAQDLPPRREARRADAETRDDPASQQSEARQATPPALGDWASL